MKVSELIEKTGLKVFTKQVVDNEVTGGYVSDLLSDVMGNAREGQIWITLQNHMNVVAVASLKDLAAILFVKGIVPADDLIAKANSEGIVLLGSDERTFEVAGKLYKLLNN